MILKKFEKAQFFPTTYKDEDFLNTEPSEFYNFLFKKPKNYLLESFFMDGNKYSPHNQTKIFECQNIQNTYTLTPYPSHNKVARKIASDFIEYAQHQLNIPTTIQKKLLLKTSEEIDLVTTSLSFLFLCCQFHIFIEWDQISKMTAPQLIQKSERILGKHRFINQPLYPIFHVLLTHIKKHLDITNIKKVPKAVVSILQLNGIKSLITPSLVSTLYPIQPSPPTYIISFETQLKPSHLTHKEIDNLTQIFNKINLHPWVGPHTLSIVLTTPLKNLKFDDPHSLFFFTMGLIDPLLYCIQKKIIDGNILNDINNRNLKHFKKYLLFHQPTPVSQSVLNKLKENWQQLNSWTQLINSPQFNSDELIQREWTPTHLIETQKIEKQLQQDGSCQSFKLSVNSHLPFSLIYLEFQNTPTKNLDTLFKSVCKEKELQGHIQQKKYSFLINETVAQPHEEILLIFKLTVLLQQFPPPFKVDHRFLEKNILSLHQYLSSEYQDHPILKITFYQLFKEKYPHFFPIKFNFKTEKMSLNNSLIEAYKQIYLAQQLLKENISFYKERIFFHVQTNNRSIKVSIETRGDKLPTSLIKALEIIKKGVKNKNLKIRTLSINNILKGKPKQYASSTRKALRHPKNKHTLFTYTFYNPEIPQLLFLSKCLHHLALSICQKDLQCWETLELPPPISTKKTFSNFLIPVKLIKKSA